VRVSNATLGEGTFLSQEWVATSHGHSMAMVKLHDVGVVFDIGKGVAESMTGTRFEMGAS
jgi:hypothetical protein